MSLNETPSANRVHIAFFGVRNVGKSSVVNAVTGQELSVVSDVKGTTTDPVSKAMELLPLGPVVIIDTPGFDDDGSLGELRVKKTRQVLNKTDVAVLVTDGTANLSEWDRLLIKLFDEKQIPYLIICNKSDLPNFTAPTSENVLSVSSRTGAGIRELKEKIASLAINVGESRRLVGDLLSPNDLVVLVIPIDESAPKGRLILPQQQVIRDILDSGAAAVATKETELKETLNSLGKPPAMVITDSQVFAKASELTPDSVPLTSFSILMARYKGFLETAVKGTAAVKQLQDNDRVLISEGCTHHRQCGDIGSVKIPRLLKKFTGKELIIETSSGSSFPEDLSPYNLVIHCGGCMLTEREIKYRMKCAAEQGIPFTNYGIAIAYMQGILKRSLSVFPELLTLSEEK